MGRRHRDTLLSLSLSLSVSVLYLSVCDVDIVAVMDGLKYQTSHEYVKMDGDVATVGISDFAQV